jgi:DNA-directed RNA polymerase subunit F
MVVDMQIKEEKFVSWVEARKILEKKADEVGELGYEQKNALEHLKRFSKLSTKKAEEFIDGLKKIEKLKERHIINIVNMLPQTQEDISMLFLNEMIELTDEEKKKILLAVKKFT